MSLPRQYNRNQPLNGSGAECRLRVAKRPSSLRIHRRKAVNEISIPESGQSPLSSTDPELRAPGQACKG